MKINSVKTMILVSLAIIILYVLGLFLPIIKNTKNSDIRDTFLIQNVKSQDKKIMKKKEYYTEELEKPSVEKMQALNNQKYYTAGSIALMFLVLLLMYFFLK